MSQTSYTVTGMTCEHCVGAVTREVSAVPGVEAVDVDLTSGRLTVRGEGAADGALDEAVRAAVDEAGYGLSGAAR